MNIIAGLTESTSTLGSFSLSSDRLIRIAVPQSFKGDIAKLTRDCEILLQRIKNKPDKFEKFVTLVNTGNFSAAQGIVKELKLTEADFEKEGGGWVVIVLIIIFLLIAHEAK